MKSAQVKACELFYHGRSLEAISQTFGYAGPTSVSSVLSSFARKMRDHVDRSALSEREAIFEFADKKYMDRDTAWYCYHACGRRIRQFLKPTSRLVPEIIRLSLKLDAYSQQLRVKVIAQRLNAMGFEKATPNSVDVIRCKLRGFGHPIGNVQKTKMNRQYDPKQGTINRLRERIERDSFFHTKATVLFWTRGMQRDVYVVKKTANEMANVLLRRYGPDHTLTGEEFLNELQKQVSNRLRIGAENSINMAA